MIPGHNSILALFWSHLAVNWVICRIILVEFRNKLKELS